MSAPLNNVCKLSKKRVIIGFNAFGRQCFTAMVKAPKDFACAVSTYFFAAAAASRSVLQNKNPVF